MTHGWSAAAHRRSVRDSAARRARRALDRLTEEIDRMRASSPFPLLPIRQQSPCMTFRAASDTADDRKTRAAAYARGAG